MRTARNRGYIRYSLFIRRTVEKHAFHRFSYGNWPRTLAKTVQRGPAANRTVGFVTAPNPAVRFANEDENRTEPYRRIHKNNEPYRTIYNFENSHRTAPFTRFSIFQTRTEPHRTIYNIRKPRTKLHRKISAFLNPHRTGP